MPLNDAKVKNAKPREEPYRLRDARGMSLEVSPSGGKYRRLPYRFGGKRKLLALGTCPDVNLTKARNRRDDARRLLSDSVDPSAAKQAAKRIKTDSIANGFEALANEWLGRTAPSWAPKHAGKVEQRFKRDILPTLGHRPIGDIAAPEVQTTAKRIEARGALETAHKSGRSRKEMQTPMRPVSCWSRAAAVSFIGSSAGG